MRVAVWISVAFSVLASGCAMAPEGPRDDSGSSEKASVELAETERAMLAGVWRKSGDDKNSIELSPHGFCQYDGVPCTFIVSAKGPSPELATPWIIDFSLANGKHESLVVCAIDAESFVVADGLGFADYEKSDEPVLVDNGYPPVASKTPKKKLHETNPTVDAIQPYGRVAGRH